MLCNRVFKLQEPRGVDGVVVFLFFLLLLLVVVVVVGWLFVCLFVLFCFVLFCFVLFVCLFVSLFVFVFAPRLWLKPAESGLGLTRPCQIEAFPRGKGFASRKLNQHNFCAASILFIYIYLYFYIYRYVYLDVPYAAPPLT